MIILHDSPNSDLTHIQAMAEMEEGFSSFYCLKRLTRMISLRVRSVGFSVYLNPHIYDTLKLSIVLRLMSNTYSLTELWSTNGS